MDLTGSSIERLVKGDATGLPVNLQILDIRRLNLDVDGTFVARLKLSDGKYYYGGFVIDMSMLSTLHVDVYAIIRVNQVMVLKHSEAKFVLQVLQMKLLDQHDKCIGSPESWYKGTASIATFPPPNNTQNRIAKSPICKEPNKTNIIIPIVELSTDISAHVIEGVVTRKSEICTFRNGFGKFFTFDIADADSEIRCKAFNEILSIFFEFITIGKAYHVENFVLTRSNKQYNHLAHAFEINLMKNSIISEIFDHKFSNIYSSFNFVKISDVSLNDVGKSIDIFITVKSIFDTDSVYVAKKNTHLHRRIITAFDDTGEINIVLWGDFAKHFLGQLNQKIRFKDLLIQNFKNQLQLSTTMMSVINMNDEDQLS